MDFSNYQKKVSLKFRVALTITVLFVILFFGLKSKGYLFSNDVHWLTKPPGIRFTGYGIAYTDPIKKLNNLDGINSNGFSIEIALKPKSYHRKGFNLLFSVHNGNDEKQLVIGQYQSSLIVMNGDDYDHSRKTKRITVKLAKEFPVSQFVTITSGKGGTGVYLDGRLVRTQKDLTLKIPEGDHARLLLGNSVYGKHSWQGDVLGLAIFRYPLSELETAIHFKNWFKDRNFLFAKKYKPDMLYVFDEGNGEKVIDRAGENIDFHIPSKMKILNKTILSFPWSRKTFNTEFFEDVMINLIGFIPLGFFLNATLASAKAGEGFERHGVLITIVFCFFVSLFIEIFQAWIPSRSSDILDLLLNTLGGGVGAFIVKCIRLKAARQED